MGGALRGICLNRAWSLVQDALQRLDERVTAGRATPAMCRTVAVAAMRAGDLLTAVMPVMLAVCSQVIYSLRAGDDAISLSGGARRDGDVERCCVVQDAAIAADDAVCQRTSQPRQLDTWAQVIRLQVSP